MRVSGEQAKTCIEAAKKACNGVSVSLGRVCSLSLSLSLTLLGVVYVIFGVRLFAVYWIVLNGMKHRVDNVLMKQKCNAASYVCATFSFSTIICKCLNSLNVFVCVSVWVWSLCNTMSSTALLLAPCALLNTVCRTIEIEFSVGIVIVFMTIVFTWMPADFSITFAQNHCFGSHFFRKIFTDSPHFRHFVRMSVDCMINAA